MRHQIPSVDYGFERALLTEPVVKDYVRGRLGDMSKAQIEELRKTINAHYLTRFNRNRKCKYGSLNKGFTEMEYTAFLRAVDSPKLRLLFEYQGTLALRVGEVVRINIRDISFEARELKIFTEKARQLDTLRIPIPLMKETIEFIQANKQAIEQAQGYLFFTEQGKTKRTEGYVEPNYIRDKFREYVFVAGLDETYAISDERGDRRPRKLHRLTTHSLRHFAITRFARSTNGNLILTSRFARHSNPNATTTYVSTAKQEVYDVIDALAVSEVAMLKKKLVER